MLGRIRLDKAALEARVRRNQAAAKAYDAQVGPINEV